MPAPQDFTINDGKGTPVAHVFSPATVAGGFLNLLDRASAAIVAGFMRLKLGNTLSEGPKKPHLCKLVITMPTVVAVDGQDTVVRTSTGGVTFTFHEGSTLAERTDVYMLVANGLANATIKDAIINVKPYYGS